MRIASSALGALAVSTIVAIAQEMPLRNETRVVVSGERAKIWSHYNLNPDCSTTGHLTVRISKAPTKGKLEHAPGSGFTAYKKDNIRFKCNERESVGVLFHYASDQGFAGTDQVEFEVISSVGSSTKYRIRIVVK